MKGLHGIAFILVIVGALNWGFVALGYWAGGDWNVVKLLLGNWPVIENIVYLLVGLSALYVGFSSRRADTPSGV